jgi:hypothetical protein
MGSTMNVEEQFRQWEWARQARRNDYWKMLRMARDEYVELVDRTEHGPNNESFYYFMQQNYGIKVNLIDGKIDSSYQIVDERKHMLFMMKYAV